MGKELFMKKELFTSTSYRHLLMYSSQTLYPQFLTMHELEIYQGFDLIWLMDQDEVVGYALIKDVLGEFFYKVEDHEEIVEVTNEDDLYSYLAYFEILQSKQDKGYGLTFLKLLLKQYKNPMIVYTTEDSVGFWLKNGFIEANRSDWWLSNKELPANPLQQVG